MAGIFGGSKQIVPKQEPVQPVMPTPDDDENQKIRRRAMQRAAWRTGRQSTIMSGETLG
jgi:hypothetical protein